MLCASWCFNVPHIFESICLRPWSSMRRLFLSHRLTRCFCRNSGAPFKCTGLAVAFLPVYALRCAYPRDRAQDNHWLRNSSSHTHEMSYEMFQGHCHSRCRISWCRSRAADLRILRHLHGVLANICCSKLFLAHAYCTFRPPNCQDVAVASTRFAACDKTSRSVRLRLHEDSGVL